MNVSLEKKGRNEQHKMIPPQFVCIRLFLNNGNAHHLVLDSSSATVARIEHNLSGWVS